jgi:hypothetical protein
VLSVEPPPGAGAIRQRTTSCSWSSEDLGSRRSSTIVSASAVTAKVTLKPRLTGPMFTSIRASALVGSPSGPRSVVLALGTPAAYQLG